MFLHYELCLYWSRLQYFTRHKPCGVKEFCCFVYFAFEAVDQGKVINHQNLLCKQQKAFSAFHTSLNIHNIEICAKTSRWDSLLYNILSKCSYVISTMCQWQRAHSRRMPFMFVSMLLFITGTRRNTAEKEKSRIWEILQTTVVEPFRLSPCVCVVFFELHLIIKIS